MGLAAKSVCLAFLTDVTLAGTVYRSHQLWRTDTDEAWEDPPTLPSVGTIWAVVGALLVLVAIMFVCCFVCSRRSRMQAVRQPLVPPPMAPANLGPTVRSYTQQPIPRRLAPPVALYPQQHQQQYYYQQQAAPYPQEGLYVGHNMAPYTEPPTAPTPTLPSAVVQPPPPPYCYPQQYSR